MACDGTVLCGSICVRLSFLYSLTIPLLLAQSEPLLCKFADGGQKKRSQNKYAQNGRGWGRDGDSRRVSGAQHEMRWESIYDQYNKGQTSGVPKMLCNKQHKKIDWKNLCRTLLVLVLLKTEKVSCICLCIFLLHYNCGVYYILVVCISLVAKSVLFLSFLRLE